MKKKLLSALLATAMTASMLAGCGSDAASGDAGQKQDAADNAAASTEAADGETVAADEGKVLNIYCWNGNWHFYIRYFFDSFS